MAVGYHSGANVHQSLPRQVKLKDILCVAETRTVGQDWCVRVERRILQIQKHHHTLALAGKPIRVLQRADGTLKLMHREEPLTFTGLASRPVAMAVPQPNPPAPPRQRPAANHPWNQSYKGTAARVHQRPSGSTR
jgi:hypothetical protein